MLRFFVIGSRQSTTHLPRYFLTHAMSLTAFLFLEMIGDKLLQDVVGVALALNALDLQRFPQIAAQGGCYFASHRYFPLFGF